MTNRNIDLGISKGSSIMQTKSIGIVLVLATAAALATGGGGCTSLPRVERVQTNLIDKSVFEGDWWYTRTVIQLDDDAAYAIGASGSGAPWAGAMSNYDITAQSGVIGRIRWVIDENFLYAYRANEVIPGSNADANSPNFHGSPLAAYRITTHVDVRQEYNPGTGEPTNVVSENTDRRWYDRQFVRVDWSQNLVTFGQFGDSLEIDELFGTFRREPAPLGVVDQGNSTTPYGTAGLPAEWAPQMVRVGEDETYRFRAEWPEEQQDTVHYMSFVTQELWSPLQCFGTACQTTIAITTREAFLRVPPNHEYAVETLANSEYDRFGIIRTEQRTYLSGGLDRAQLGEHCSADSECSTNACDATRHVCVGGLTDELGETDFLTYYRLRHNFYSDSLTDTECQADWQCDGRYDGFATGAAGSICDQHAHVCTIPIVDRPIREVAYYLSPGYPTYLTRSAFEIVGMWNEAFMHGNRAVHGRALPSGPPVACQSANPTDYCYCNPDHSFLSGEVDPSAFTCAFRVNWFATRQQQLDAGVTDPYNCWVDAPPDLEHPTQFGLDGPGIGYDPAVQSQTHFTSDPADDSECMLVLHVNSCDAHPATDTDPGMPCEQLGDIRYNMFNYVSAAASGFCGVMQPMQDPTNGEAIVSPINMGGQCLDNFGVQPLVYWPILRGDEPTDDLISGDEVRRYFAALGHVQGPVGIAPGAEPGFDVTDVSRPSLPSDLHAFFRDQIEEHLDDVRGLHGAEGRAQILSDRMGNVRLTPEGRQLEQRYAAASASEGFPSTTTVEAMAATALGTSVGVIPEHLDLGDETTMNRISAFRPEFIDGTFADIERQHDLMTRGTCMMMERPALVYASQYGEYWARAFDESRFSREEARIRWAQAWHRAVMQHELGHGLGLEHNFAGTLDRDNYMPGYFGIAMRDTTGPGGVGGPDGLPDLLLPRLIDFDLNRDGQITGDEQTAWLAETQRVRHERNVHGAGNFTSSTTMDYPGDLSNIYSIGTYDHAAVYFNYFNQVEAYANHCTDVSGPGGVGGPDGILQASECQTPDTDLPGTSADGLLRSDQFDRTLVPWYRGGDHCANDSECPFSGAGGGSGESITQRCVTNPRYSSIPLPCGSSGSDATHCICSSFDSDFIDYVDGNAYRDRRDGQQLSPVQYLFCSNPRLNDISWCSAFDAGESFQEVIANYRAEWESRYLTSYFRRHHRPFTTGSRAQRYIPDAAKIYQHFLFRLIYEPRFAADNGPLGLDDQYAASIDVMNWFAQLAAMPDVGSYAFDPTVGAHGAYHHLDEAYAGVPGTDLTLEPGQGFYHWSQYQTGNLGFFRMERAGVFWDQLLALRALTIRDWGLSYTVDERYYINFYSFFPVEMTELFGGYILDDPEWFAPRVRTATDGSTQVQYVNWFRGTDIRGGGCRNPTTGVLGPCRPATEVAFPNPVVENVSNDILRVYATIFALNEFPVFYDTSWERRLAVFALGSGDGFTIPDTQRDGTATCAYGTLTTAPGHASGCTATDADYITYTSDHLHTTYVAVKIRSRDSYNLEEEQLGFEYLLELNTTQDRVRVLDAREAAGTITAAERLELGRRRETLSSNESYLATLIELQRIFGINSYL